MPHNVPDASPTPDCPAPPAASTSPPATTKMAPERAAFEDLQVKLRQAVDRERKLVEEGEDAPPSPGGAIVENASETEDQDDEYWDDFLPWPYRTMRYVPFTAEECRDVIEQFVEYLIPLGAPPEEVGIAMDSAVTMLTRRHVL